jgi:hypothetical protein
MNKKLCPFYLCMWESPLSPALGSIEYSHRYQDLGATNRRRGTGMSGTFMDGGNNDHGGHNPGHGSGGDGGGFMDGHDHSGHQTHSGHGSGGGGSNFLNHLLGYNSDTGHHSFLSHLLGLDHDAHHGSHGGHGGLHGGDGAGQNPSQTPIWTSALQGLKLSHALEGLNISTNVWFFFFYLCCIAWLFVIFWLRHHEPLANSVLGKGNAKYETAAADQRIMDNCRDATPIRTSQNQQLFAPMPSQFNDPAAQQAIAAAAANPAPTMMGTTWMPPAALPQAAPPTETPSATQAMASYYNQASPFGSPVITPQMIPNPSGPGHLVALPMSQNPGSQQRLKMIINR